MSSIEKEKGMLKEWAIKATSRIEEYDVDRESYWSMCEIGEDITEYDFQTIPELKKLLEKSLAECEDVVLPLSVATFKKKKHSVSEFDEVNSSAKSDFSISDFIYVF